MELFFIPDENLLCILCKEQAQSPEEFLLEIEDALESGELTIDEAHQLIIDHNRRNKT
jgi:hypothetical protein